MKLQIEENIKEIINRINKISKDNNLNKEYRIYFQDEKVRPKVNPKYKSNLRYGVHLICDVIYGNKIVKDTEGKVIEDGVMTIFKKSYLCKDYKDYLKMGYKPYLLNVLLYELMLLGIITIEADTMKKKKEMDDIPNAVMNKD